MILDRKQSRVNVPGASERFTGEVEEFPCLATSSVGKLKANQCQQFIFDADDTVSFV